MRPLPLLSLTTAVLATFLFTAPTLAASHHHVVTHHSKHHLVIHHRKHHVVKHRGVKHHIVIKRVVKPKVTSPVVHVPTKPGCSAYDTLLQKYFGPDWLTFKAIMHAESGCNPLAVNWRDNHGSCHGSFGLLQVNCHNGALYDPEANIKAASTIFRLSGFHAWGAFTNGSYRQYLQSLTATT